MTDFPARRCLSSGRVSLDLLPAWGGKAISLRTERDGYEFLAAAPCGPHEPDPSIFAAADAYGWDEMFPGCLPETLAGLAQGPIPVADHGDLWYRPWNWEERSAELRLWASDERLGWHILKRLHFEDPYTLVVRYRLKCVGRLALPWVYYSHILLRYGPGISVTLPRARYRRLETYGEPVAEECSSDYEALTRFEKFPEKSAAFYVSDRLAARRVVFRDLDAGKTLRLRWTAPLDYLGVWYNRAGSTDDMPLVHLGIEPATSPYPGLVETFQAGMHQECRPGRAIAWRLTLRVEEAAGL